jgi:homoserine kinase type II
LGNDPPRTGLLRSIEDEAVAAVPRFTPTSIARLLADYDLGEFRSFRRFTEGGVQTNLLVTTTQGRCVLRYYVRNRSVDSARFEARITHYLHARGYPCPAPLRRRRGGFVGVYRERPYAIFTFLEGRSVPDPNAVQRAQIVRKAAELHLLARGYRPAGREARHNYNVAFVRERAASLAKARGTQEATLKRRWMEHELDTLVLPANLPQGLCHADFAPENLLFEGDTLVAVLDFDDANVTYLTFDLVNLMGWYGGELNFTTGRQILQEYESHRPPIANERRHLYDVVKLQILIDCLWFFDRGGPADFYEKRKIERLNAMGRDGFHARMFG